MPHRDVAQCVLTWPGWLQEAERQIRLWHTAIAEHAEWATNLAAMKRHQGEIDLAKQSISRYQTGISERDQHISHQRRGFAAQTLRRAIAKWTHIQLMRLVRNWHASAHIHAACRGPGRGAAAYHRGEAAYLRQLLVEKDAEIAELRLRCTTERPNPSPNPSPTPKNPQPKTLLKG